MLGENSRFVFAVRCCQPQRGPLQHSQALRLFEQAAGHAASAGDLAHAEAGKPPGIAIALDPGGAQQAIIEAPGEQQAVSKSTFDQLAGVWEGRQQPVGRVGVDRSWRSWSLGWVRCWTTTGMLDPRIRAAQCRAIGQRRPPPVAAQRPARL